MMDALTLSRSEEIKKAVAELHRQMAARKWVEDRPPEQAKTLTPLTLGKVVDHNQDGLPTLFVYAIRGHNRLQARRNSFLALGFYRPRR